MKILKPSLIILALFVLVILVAPRFFIHVIPPESMTDGSMHMMKRRILRYAHLHNELPREIKDLPVMEGYSNSTQDGWGREIPFVIKDNTVTLTSYGKDGQPGGNGDDEDMIGIFSLKDKNNAWEKELAEWIKDPFNNPLNEKARQ